MRAWIAWLKLLWRFPYAPKSARDEREAERRRRLILMSVATATPWTRFRERRREWQRRN